MLSSDMDDTRAPMAWAAACIGTSLLCTFAFACATPLAGLAALVALKLPRSQALGVAGATWLANQAVGFVFLHYPLTWDCFAWGAAIGIATLASCATARECGRLSDAMMRAGCAFLAAFAVFEALLLAVTPVLGGEGAFTIAVVGRIFAINAATFLVLSLAARALLRPHGVAVLPARS